ncbi:uncharacterized protein Bfra_003434 [Botrytis fragariae]|uniref:Uncharacterized protein n=1 Tax=Botrytis fragariae TaxID=1964551 RepID=A0A8H6EJX2_9HELO|nr:uncharacterized protein Bfra_003434 [Botrytis fragariae]KAF5874981.1 hypothetical protein Bfra_003434 [Botrytis fragariae]
MYGIQSYFEDRAEVFTPFGTQDMYEYLYEVKLAQVRERSPCRFCERLNNDALFELGSDIGSPDLNRTKSMRGLPVFSDGFYLRLQ